MEDDYKRAIANLIARVEANGVGAIKVSDGEVFMFSRSIVQRLLDNMDSSGQDRAVLFVKTDTGKELKQ